MGVKKLPSTVLRHSQGKYIAFSPREQCMKKAAHLISSTVKMSQTADHGIYQFKRIQESWISWSKHSFLPQVPQKSSSETYEHEYSKQVSNACPKLQLMLGFFPCQSFEQNQDTKILGDLSFFLVLSERWTKSQNRNANQHVCLKVSGLKLFWLI